MELVQDDRIDWNAYLKQPADAALIRPASDWREDVIQRLRGEEQRAGAKLPWFITHDRLRFRPGELSVWAGSNGHGKSLLQSQVMLGIVAQGERCCIASLEMKPVATMHRMTRQAVAGRFPTAERVRDFLAWTDRKLWLYDQQGSVSHDRMLALGRYVASEFGVQHFVIDSLMKCGINVDDLNLQKRYVDQLCAIAKDTGMHIHLVAHMKKNDAGGNPQDKYGIKGAGEISDLADNVLIVWRNKPKEENPDKHRLDPDATLTVDKQRHGEWEGRIRLWFEKTSMTYLETETDRPRDYETLAEGLCRR